MLKLENRARQSLASRPRSPPRLQPCLSRRAATLPSLSCTAHSPLCCLMHSQKNKTTPGCVVTMMSVGGVLHRVARRRALPADANVLFLSPPSPPRVPTVCEEEQQRTESVRATDCGTQDARKQGEPRRLCGLLFLPYFAFLTRGLFCSHGRISACDSYFRPIL